VGDGIRLRSRNEILLSQVETLVPLADLAGGLAAEPALAPFIEGLVEALHMILETLAESMADPDPTGVELLRGMTGDRGEVVEGCAGVLADRPGCRRSPRRISFA
jgi:phosphate:Na+ symporter